MLLAVQVFSILFYGLMTDSQLSHVIFNCLGLLVPILAVWIVYRSPATNWIGLVLALIAIGRVIDSCQMFTGMMYTAIVVSTLVSTAVNNKKRAIMRAF